VLKLVKVVVPAIVDTFKVDTERVVPEAVEKEASLVYTFFAETELQLT
jgi:hypothetical protein